jgi:hypothetical protein
MIRLQIIAAVALWYFVVRAAIISLFAHQFGKIDLESKVFATVMAAPVTLACCIFAGLFWFVLIPWVVEGFQ